MVLVRTVNDSNEHGGANNTSIFFAGTMYGKLGGVDIKKTRRVTVAVGVRYY